MTNRGDDCLLVCFVFLKIRRLLCNGDQWSIATENILGTSNSFSKRRVMPGSGVQRQNSPPLKAINDEVSAW